MKDVGVAEPDQKKIDIECEWMNNYIARNTSVGSISRQKSTPKSTPAPSPPQSELTGTEEFDWSGASVPTPQQLLIVKFQKDIQDVNKGKLDNGAKAKKLVSRKIVQSMIEMIDGAWNKIIIDGEASFVPQLIQKIKSGCIIETDKGGNPRIVFETPEEEIKKFWRKEITKILGPVKPYMQRSLKRAVEDK